MKPFMAALAAVGLLVIPAWGDRIFLKDGRTFEGAVTESSGEVFIDTPYGTIGFPASEVVRIERGPTAEEELAERLAAIDRTDPERLFKLACWADERGLVRQSRQLLGEVIQLRPDHAAARRMLRQVKVGGKWLGVSAAMEVARSKLEVGEYETLLKSLLPALGEVVTDSRDRLRLLDLRANCLLRSGRYEQARGHFRALAQKCPPPRSLRYSAIADILRNHPDGMYLLTEPYPPTAGLLADPVAPVKRGPASLSRPRVLEAALRDFAKRYLRKGRALMDQAKRLELTEPEAAKAKYALAVKAFDAADAVVPNLTRSYRVEIVRRRIAMITKDMNTEARKFDALKAELGERNLTPAAYANLILRMMRALKNVRQDLEAILRLATDFEEELALEVTDAKLRLERINALLGVLGQELHGGNR